jgi:hypothetical protein
LVELTSNGVSTVTGCWEADPCTAAGAGVGFAGAAVVVVVVVVVVSDGAVWANAGTDPARAIVKSSEAGCLSRTRFAFIVWVFG